MGNNIPTENITEDPYLCTQQKIYENNECKIYNQELLNKIQKKEKEKWLLANKNRTASKQELKILDYQIQQTKKKNQKCPFKSLNTSCPALKIIQEQFYEDDKSPPKTYNNFAFRISCPDDMDELKDNDFQNIRILKSNSCSGKKQ